MQVLWDKTGFGGMRSGLVEQPVWFGGTEKVSWNKIEVLPNIQV